MPVSLLALEIKRFGFGRHAIRGFTLTKALAEPAKAYQDACGTDAALIQRAMTLDLGNGDDTVKSELELLRRSVEKLEQGLEAVQHRNAKVETDKKWETSKTRFACVAAITYLTMNLILWSIDGPFPPIHAIVPTCGYMLSTLSLPKVKEWWRRRYS